MKTSNTPRLCAGPQVVQQTPTKFWNIASVGEDSGEIVLYGDVVARQPVDWWTGEPEPGLYIAPESFMEDLAAVKGKSNITIKINSCGGDLYTGIAIHNAIKGLTGHKVVVVEGIAASAASVIACAGDEVQVYPGSMVMIHGVAGLLYDYYTLADLKKLQKDFDASERAIAEIYHAKTGIEVDQLRSMMTRETWMVGQEAIDNGFADTLLTDEGPDVTLSADKKVLLVAGIRHDVKGFRHIPGTIPIDNSIHAAPAAGNKHAAAKNDGPKKEDNKTMTLEEMRAQHPDVVAQIEQQAAETARTQERARIEAIDSIAASVGDAQLVRDAKYGETACTAEQLALKAMQKQAALGAKHLKDAALDNADSGAGQVGAAPNGGEEGSETDDKAKVAAAYKFMEYACHDAEGIKTRVDGGAFPADNDTLKSNDFLNMTSLTDSDGKAHEYFGGQKFNEELAKAAANVSTGYKFLPFEVYARGKFGDYAGDAYTGKTTLSDAVASWQKDLQDYAKQQGYQVK